MTVPKVSVVCPIYNRADYIRDTLESLLAQDLDSFEIILINDGSPDPRVREVLDSYDDPRLQVVHQENTGFTLAIRRAIELSRAPFIAIQGAGDVSLPSRLRLQWEALQADGSLCAVGCQVSNVIVDENGFGEERSRPVLKSRWSLKDILGPETMFTHGEVMFRREIYDLVGGYRPFFKFAQDRDLWLRMAEHGDFLVLTQHLYQRRNFAQDGVSKSIEKTILQKRLSTLAIQCHLERRRDGTDCIDRHGWLAGLLRKPSPIMADTVARLAIKELQFGSLEAADDLMEIAKREGTTRITVLARLLNWICWIKGGRRLVICVLGAVRNARSGMARTA